MQRRTKALSISAAVKQRVYERDGGLCIFCKSPGDPVAHFVARSQGGLGIEENVICACSFCHRRMDATTDRDRMKNIARKYLQSKYTDWDESKLYYDKWRT